MTLQKIYPHFIEDIGASRPKPRKRVPDDFPAQKDKDWALDPWLKRGRTDLAGGIDDQIAHSGTITPATERAWPTGQQPGALGRNASSSMARRPVCAPKQLETPESGKHMSANDVDAEILQPMQRLLPAAPEHGRRPAIPSPARIR